MEAFLMFVKGLFAGVWSLYSTPVPGFNFSVGTLMLTVLIIEIALSLIFFMLGINSGGAVKGGNNRKIKISKDRRGDTK